MSQVDIFSFLDQPAVKPARKPAVRKPKVVAPAEWANPLDSLESLAPPASMEPAEAPETKASAKAPKKLSAASESALMGVYTRNLVDWLERESDCLLDCVLADPREAVKKSRSKTPNIPAKSAKPLRLDDFAVKFSRDSVLVMAHLIDSEILDMAGIEMQAGSDEACEFMGLAFSGVPLNLALRWCAATEDESDRPLWADIEACMTAPDRRGAMRLVRGTGLWFTASSQLWALDMLAEQDEADVRQAVLAVIERVDAPTPDVVSQQMFGAFEGDAPVDWTGMSQSAGAGFVSDLFAAPSGTARKGRWGRVRTGGVSSVPDGALPGSAEYSANPGNWGGKKKASYRKRRASGTRTIKAGNSYKSVGGKARIARQASKAAAK